MPAPATQEGHLLVGRNRRKGWPAWLQGVLVTVLVGASFSLVIAAVYSLSHDALINEIHAGLSRTTRIALRRIDPELHKTITRAEQHATPEYERAVAPLRDILLSEPLVAFTWTAILESDGSVHFILDGTLPPKPGEAWSELAVKPMQEYPNPPSQVARVFRHGEAVFTEPYTDEWGTFISSFAPIKDRDGVIIAVFAIDLRVTDFQARLRPVRHAAMVAAGIGAAVAILMGLAVYRNGRKDRREQELSRQLRITNALLAMARALASKVGLDELSPVILKQTVRVMGSQSSALYWYDAGRDKLRVQSSSTDCSDSAPLSPAGIVGRALRSGQTQRVRNMDMEPDFAPAVDRAGVEGELRSLIAAPICDARGQALGVLVAANKSGDEFDADDQILIEALCAQVFAAIDRARLTEAYVEKQKLDEALKLAASIQMSMLSRSFPPPSGEVEVHAAIVPAKQVGGDFYDFFWVSDRELAFLVADVSGKGMPAALFMAKAKTLIKAHAGLVQAPSDILAKANDELAADNDAGMFVTVFLALLNVDSGEMRYANAGHNHPYLLLSGNCERLPLPNDTALGVLEGLGYEQSTRQLHAGETVFLYTDGVNEAMDAEHRQFEYSRLEAVLRQPFVNTAELDDRVLQAVHAFADGAEPSDDITVLSIRWQPHTRPVD